MKAHCFLPLIYGKSTKQRLQNRFIEECCDNQFVRDISAHNLVCVNVVDTLVINVGILNQSKV